MTLEPDTHENEKCKVICNGNFQVDLKLLTVPGVPVPICSGILRKDNHLYGCDDSFQLERKLLTVPGTPDPTSNAPAP